MSFRSFLNEKVFKIAVQIEKDKIKEFVKKVLKDADVNFSDHTASVKINKKVVANWSKAHKTLTFFNDWKQLDMNDLQKSIEKMKLKKVGSSHAGQTITYRYE